MNLDWLLEPGTNKYVIMFLDNNSFLLVSILGSFFAYLKYKAKQTATPDDDKLVAEIENKVMGLFKRKVDEKLR